MTGMDYGLVWVEHGNEESSLKPRLMTTSSLLVCLGFFFRNNHYNYHCLYLCTVPGRWFEHSEHSVNEKIESNKTQMISTLTVHYI